MFLTRFKYFTFLILSSIPRIIEHCRSILNAIPLSLWMRYVRSIFNSIAHRRMNISLTSDPNLNVLIRNLIC